MNEWMNPCTKHQGCDLSSSFSMPQAFSQHIPCALTDAQDLPDKVQSWLTYHREANLPSQGGWPGAASKKQEGTVVCTVTFKKMLWAVQAAEQSRKDRAKGLCWTLHKTHPATLGQQGRCVSVQWGTRKRMGVILMVALDRGAFSQLRKLIHVHWLLHYDPSPILRMRKLKQSKISNFSKGKSQIWLVNLSSRTP